MAKLVASETAMWATTKAVQIHGGYGYMREFPVERYMRDAKLGEIGEGHERGAAHRHRARGPARRHREPLSRRQSR
jgi:alkylation response protein AidB-like acyl-CoA dehydrogenase